MSDRPGMSPRTLLAGLLAGLLLWALIAALVWAAATLPLNGW